MAVLVGDKLQKTSLVLTRTQIERMREIASSQSTDLRKVSMSDICREAVEIGLGVIHRVPNIAFGASGDRETFEAEKVPA